MEQGRMIVLTGAPGTGKTTASAIVAEKSERKKSVHMHTDDFYHYLCKGAIAPHLPEADGQALNGRVYEYESLLYEAGKTGGAYVIFPYDIRKEFGRGRVKVHATFDGEPYDGSVVNMGVKNADGSVCYIIGVRKDIRSRIGKQPGDRVLVTVRERE